MKLVLSAQDHELYTGTQPEVRFHMWDSHKYAKYTFARVQATRLNDTTCKRIDAPIAPKINASSPHMSSLDLWAKPRKRVAAVARAFAEALAMLRPSEVS